MGKHRSRPYNPHIASTFFKAGYVETWGRGIQKICSSCAKYGSPPPEYTVHSEDIMVKFLAKTGLGAKSSSSTDNGSLEAQDGSLEAQDGTLKVQNGSLDKDAYRLLEQICHDPTLSREQYAQVLGLTLRTVQRKLDLLKEVEAISRKGGKRFGHWEVKNSKMAD